MCVRMLRAYDCIHAYAEKRDARSGTSRSRVSLNPDDAIIYYTIKPPMSMGIIHNYSLQIKRRVITRHGFHRVPTECLRETYTILS